MTISFHNYNQTPGQMVAVKFWVARRVIIFGLVNRFAFDIAADKKDEVLMFGPLLFIMAK